MDRSIINATFFNNCYFWFFLISIVVMAAPLFLNQFSWFYFYWALLFFLGIFIKVIAHQFFDYVFVEPIGNFSGSMAEWDSYFLCGALMASAIGLTGFLLGTITSSKRFNSKLISSKAVPKTKPSIWFYCAFAIVILFILNQHFQIYVVGVRPLYQLPFYLGIPLSFLIYLGSSIVLAAYVADDVTHYQRLRLPISIFVLLVFFCQSLLTGSRAPIVVEAFPILLGASYTQFKINKYKISYKPYFYAVLFLLLSLVAVSFFRIHYFYGKSLTDFQMILFYAKEGSSLFVDRWTGAEALMVGVSYPNASMNVFAQLMVESPSKGAESLYQIISGSYDRFELYRKEGANIFATLPGYVGILALSGSYALIFFGTSLLTAFGMLYEFIITKLLYRQYVYISLVSASLAYFLTQMQYTKLFVIYLFNLTIFILLIHYGFLRRKFQ